MAAEWKIIEDYEAGGSMIEVATGNKVSPATVFNVLKRNNVKRRPRGGTKKEFGEREFLMVSKYKAGRTIASIAKQFETSPLMVSTILKKNGIEIRPTNARAEQSHNWTGGRVIDPHGYVLVKLTPKHWLWEFSNNIGYIREHRLVFAAYLGRPLEKWETVHHKDGNRQNNAIANLQLRIGNHGQGQAYVCACCGSNKLKPMEIV